MTAEELNEYFSDEPFAVQLDRYGIVSFATCSKCAAVVRFFSMEKHIAWHKVWHQ